MNLNATDRITILYNFILVIFIFIFRPKIPAFTYHLAFNLSAILLVTVLRRRNMRSLTLRILSLWYPLFFYPFLYYQTGLLNRIVVPQFLDDFFMNLDVMIFGEFPGFFLQRAFGNAFFEEFFHFFYFSYYLIIPLTGILLYRKNEKLFERFVFQLSSLFCVCYLIYLFLPVEGPIALRDGDYHHDGLFRAIVDFIYAKGENPGAAFPSSHVAVTLLVAWWGSKHFGRMKIFYWLTCLFLSIATVYCMFHYAVDVMGGLFLGALAILIFHWIDRNSNYEKILQGKCRE